MSQSYLCCGSSFIAFISDFSTLPISLFNDLPSNSLRPLLFLPQLSLPSESLLAPSGPSRLLVWHYLLVLAPDSFPMPHSKKGVSKSDYVKSILNQSRGEEEALETVFEIVSEVKQEGNALKEEEREWLKKLEEWKSLVERQ